MSLIDMQLSIIICALIGITSIYNCNSFSLYYGNADDTEINIFVSSVRRNQQVSSSPDDDDRNEDQIAAPIAQVNKQANVFEEHQSRKNFEESSKERVNLPKPSKYSNEGM